MFFFFYRAIKNVCNYIDWHIETFSICNCPAEQNDISSRVFEKKKKLHYTQLQKRVLILVFLLIFWLLFILVSARWRWQYNYSNMECNIYGNRLSQLLFLRLLSVRVICFVSAWTRTRNCVIIMWLVFRKKYIYPYIYNKIIYVYDKFDENWNDIINTNPK